MSDPRTVSLISIAANDIPVEFPEAAAKEAEDAKAAPMGDRLDLRKLPLVTIDGEDARDFDDAVFAEPDPDHPGGWRLLVAIADVAWYVRPDKPLDRAAYRRGTSVYFPDRVVPMLPERCPTTGARCVPRAGPAGAGRRDVDRRRRRSSRRHRFHRAMMRSAARLTYNRVQRAIDGHPDEETGAAARAAWSSRSTAPSACCWRRARSAARSTSTCRSGWSGWATTAASPRSACANGSTATS